MILTVQTLTLPQAAHMPKQEGVVMGVVARCRQQGSVSSNVSWRQLGVVVTLGWTRVGAARCSRAVVLLLVPRACSTPSTPAVPLLPWWLYRFLHGH